MQLQRWREGEGSAMEYDEGELMLIYLDDREMGHQVRMGKQLELPEKIALTKVLRDNVDLFLGTRRTSSALTQRLWYISLILSPMQNQ